MLRLYVGVHGGIGILESHVSGPGGPYFSDTDHTYLRAKTEATRMYWLNFRAVRKGERISAQFTLLSGREDAYVELYGVTLQNAGHNLAPNVHFVAPAPGSTFITPTDVTLEAAADDPDGFIQRVEFYNGSLALKAGEATSPPYRLVVHKPAGFFGSFCARAYDNLGLAWDSEVLKVKVEDPSVPFGAR